MDICNFVRLDTGILVIIEYFFEGPTAMEIFQKILFNRLKLIKYNLLPFKKTSSELICAY